MFGPDSNVIDKSDLANLEVYDLSERAISGGVAAGDEAEGYAHKKALQPCEADLADERHKVVNLEVKCAALREEVNFWQRAAFQSNSFAALRAWWFCAKCARKRVVPAGFCQFMKDRFASRD